MQHVPDEDSDLGDMYWGKNENNCHICRYFFISQNYEEVNKFSFYRYPLKKKRMNIYHFVHATTVF